MRALERSKTKTRELLGGTKEYNILPHEGLLICPPGNFFYKKQSKRIEIVTSPVGTAVVGDFTNPLASFGATVLTSL